MSGFKTRKELENFIKRQGNKNLSFEYTDKRTGASMLYESQKCPECHLWHNRPDTAMCPDCESGIKPKVYKGDIYNNPKNFPSMKKRKEGWI